MAGESPSRSIPSATHCSASIAPALRAMACVLAGFLACIPTAMGQAITIDTKSGNQVGTPGAPVDRRFAQIEPTKVALTKTSLNPKTKLELIRLLQSEQGFAMRPFPRGHKGLTLVANGKLEPAGEAYLGLVTSEGLSSKPGDRVVLTDVKFERDRIVFMLNGGPDLKHRFLRHIEIGSSSTMGPVVQDSGEEATGARLTLVFKGGIPEMTGTDVKALLAPLISFDVKTPIQAFTDTLPPVLKNAILNHHVLVGMTTDMVLFAKGEPEHKTREMEGQMPFEEWIYGKPPQDVEFVRINGNRVIRVELAKMGAPVQIFEKDVVEGMMRTDGTPLTPGEAAGAHTAQLGDVHRDPDTQAPTAPPTLRSAGEQLPGDAQRQKDPYAMKPVRFPSQRPDDQTATDPSAAPVAPQAQPGTTQVPQPAAPATSTQATPAAPPQEPNSQLMYTESSESRTLP